MDPAYITWIALIAGGVVLALFVRPRHVLVCGAMLMACTLTGLVVSGLLGSGSLATLFGLAAMAIPVVFGMLAAGASIGAALIGKVRGNSTSS